MSKNTVDISRFQGLSAVQIGSLLRLEESVTRTLYRNGLAEVVRQYTDAEITFTAEMALYYATHSRSGFACYDLEWCRVLDFTFGFSKPLYSCLTECGDLRQLLERFVVDVTDADIRRLTKRNIAKADIRHIDAFEQAFLGGKILKDPDVFEQLLKIAVHERQDFQRATLCAKALGRKLFKKELMIIGRGLLQYTGEFDTTLLFIRRHRLSNLYRPFLKTMMNVGTLGYADYLAMFRKLGCKPTRKDHEHLAAHFYAKGATDALHAARDLSAITGGQEYRLCLKDKRDEALRSARFILAEDLAKKLGEPLTMEQIHQFVTCTNPDLGDHKTALNRLAERIFASLQTPSTDPAKQTP